MAYEVHRLRLLLARRGRLKANVVPSWVDLVDLGAELRVRSNEGHHYERGKQTKESCSASNMHSGATYHPMILAG
jgi:hypothetical protein